MSEMLDILNDLDAESVTVKRYDSGSYVNGLYVAGDTDDITAVVSLQPMPGKELLNLPEAQRTRRWLKGYSDTELLTASQSDSKKADLFEYDGTTFEVMRSDKWVGGSLSHWRILAAELDS
jgi:hypothetical protein